MHAIALRLLLSSLWASAALALPPRIWERAQVIDNVTQLNQSYDYVIIGGGTSGLTVADRLTEDQTTTVLVIEYGYVDAQDPGVVVPGIAVPGNYSRNYQSVPQPGLNNRPSPVYTGAVVGGGTVVNGMFFNRGSKGDYDAWANLGNPGWAWEDLLPYFKKSENFTPPPPDLAEKYPISGDLTPHGTTGPIGSSFSRYQYPIIANYFPAWSGIGVSLNPQPNAGNANGVFYSPLSLNFDTQSRSTSSGGHYRPVFAKRSNYHLVTGQNVLKIILDQNKAATSVTFADRTSSATNSVSTRKEVILAAGAVHSPQILQLSGIGPKKLLSSLGIDTLVDLPGVGYNFHDQPSMFLSFNYTKYNDASPDWFFSRPDWVKQQRALYDANRTGAYTIPYESGSIVTFLPLQNITQESEKFISDARAVQLEPLLPEGASHQVLKGYKRLVDLLLRLYASPNGTVQETAFGGGSTVPVAMLKPLSRGSILINTTDPFAPPVIDYQTFKHRTDLDVAVLALKKNRQFMASAPMKDDLGAVEAVPGVQVQGDEAIANSIRTFATSTWSHPVGTCAMMKFDEGGVVDSELKVYGVPNLRVVDASIMPLIPGTHTSSTVYAVAEKAADMIRGKRTTRVNNGYGTSGMPSHN